MLSMKRGRDIYVLVRVFDAYLSVSQKQSVFLDRLRGALHSVRKNIASYAGRGSVFLLINDDTPNSKEGYPEHRNKLDSLLREEGFLQGYDLFFTDSPGGEGSSAATLRIRRCFVKLASAHSVRVQNAIAVSLDQDDVLLDGALKSIAGSLKPNGIVLSQYDAKGDKHLDDGGKVHNSFSRFLCLPSWIQRVFLFRRKLPVRDICYASTIGWTKSYSGEILERYLRDLEEFFNTKRKGGGDVALEYFKAHRSYEDFLDFYALLYKDVNLSGTRRKTHGYIKRSDSITSTPTLEAFRDHRTASLINLVDLCYYHGEKNGHAKLRADFKTELLRHLSVKILQIEQILSNYRDAFTGGSETRSDALFAKNTHDGYFFSKLSRLVRNDNRGTEDEKLFGAAVLTINEDTKSNFEDLYSRINEVYGLKLKSFFIKYTMMKACEKENSVHKIRIVKKEESVEHKYDKSLTPKQIQFRVMIVVDIVIFAVGVAGFFIFRDGTGSDRLVAGFCTVMAAILTFSLNESSKLRTSAREELSQKRLYYSEFEDLIRHLEANVKVMIQMKAELEDGTIARPSSVHLMNLKWPSNSCLFSDAMARIIDKEKVDDFARLKVNLRNINNSSEWLLKYSEGASYSKFKMIEMIDWELTRNFGYYINFLYVRSHKFSFPTQFQLDTYVADAGVRNQLSLFFLGKDQETAREEVTRLISQYYNDRRERRSILDA